MNEQNNNSAGWTPVPFSAPVQSCPVIEVDCSEWSKLLQVCLRASTAMTPETQSKLAEQLLAGIDQLDKARGGTGFRVLGARAVDTEVVITLAPIESAHAKERIAALCADLSRPNGDMVPTDAIVLHASAA
jgi:hypothetical protein